MNRPNRPRDPNQLAKLILDIATGEPDALAPDNAKKAKTSAQTRKAGIAGGKARADKLSPEARKDIAKKGASTRWAKKA